jgi:saccharopine dehydrogenase-like NADP-dependent oxidoreductase
MNRSAAFGVIGGCGSTAKAVVKELLRSTDKRILIGARNLANAEAVAANLGVAASAVRVDIRDARSLGDFCGRSSIVVNCGGRVCELQDLVAQAALRMRSHYVDVAGLTVVREGMMPHHQEVGDRGLSYVVSAGWLPGMSELLPAYSLALAKTRMDAVQSMTIHFGDSGEWSNNALRDAAWYLRKFGRRRPGYIHNGRWVRARLSEVLVEKDIGSPMGRCLFSVQGLRCACVLLPAESSYRRSWIFDRAAADADIPCCSDLASGSSRAVITCWRIQRRRDSGSL